MKPYIESRNCIPSQVPGAASTCLGVLLLCLATEIASPQTYWVIPELSGSWSGLQSSGTTLYGVSVDLYGFPIVYAFDADSSPVAVIRRVAEGSGGPGGSGSAGSLRLSGSTLYGTSYGNYGGGPSNVGSIFKLNTDGTGYSVLKYFTGADGANPSAALTPVSGTLYGTTSGGGLTNRGVIYKINADGSDFTVLKNFMNADGSSPQAALVASGITLYGTTAQGGSNTEGTVFAINTDGSGFVTLRSFAGSDGANPCSALLLSGTTLYGTTVNGGAANHGCIFKMSTDGSGFALLKSFNGGDGASPYGDLVLSGDILYGTTSSGGTSNLGTVFQVNTDGSGYSVLKDFTGGNGDGAHPYAGTTLCAEVLYGVTRDGGSQGHGVVFGLAVPTVQPRVVVPPRSQTIQAGDPASFVVRASGSPVLSYQWFFNATIPVTGITTNPAAQLTNLQASDQGPYTAVITNSFGSVTSAPAMLEVIPAGTTPVKSCTEGALRAAVAGAGPVTFDCDGTITLSAPLTVSNNLAIDGTGRHITISGRGLVPVFSVNSNVTLTLNELTIAQGASTNGGGGIYNPGGTVNASNCVFRGNAALGVSRPSGVDPGYGGAIFNGGTMNASGCAFTDNLAAGASGPDGHAGGAAGSPGSGQDGGPACGGAIYNTGSAFLDSSLFSSNVTAGGAGGRGGDGGFAIAAWPVDLTGGHGGRGGDGNGGALFSVGSASLVNCTFAGNIANGGSGGSGGYGGILADSPHDPTPTYFPGGNGGDGGSGLGAIYGGLLFLTNCTIAVNSASGGSGGTGGGSSLGNAMGGANGYALGGLNSYQASLVNTLLATNLPVGNAAGSLVDWGGNLSSDDTCHFTTPGSLNNVDPKLGPLRDNGGSTLTMALWRGSPAVDAGNDPAAPPTDQRGFPRPFGNASDIGAYEAVPLLQVNQAQAGGIDLFAFGLTGSSCRLLATTNFSDWLPISYGKVAPDGTTSFHDDFSDTTTSRFYRVISP